ncbi:hypothetical protein RHIZ404_220427 [Rhizobium sp. EC-SD404]|nr:hypothetical protein RHIZ404_220427 [Rhizobium sp. EC-SD404]
MRDELGPGLETYAWLERHERNIRSSRLVSIHDGPNVQRTFDQFDAWGLAESVARQAQRSIVPPDNALNQEI